MKKMVTAEKTSVMGRKAEKWMFIFLILLTFGVMAGQVFARETAIGTIAILYGTMIDLFICTVYSGTRSVMLRPNIDQNKMFSITQDQRAAKPGDLAAHSPDGVPDREIGREGIHRMGEHTGESISIYKNRVPIIQFINLFNLDKIEFLFRIRAASFGSCCSAFLNSAVKA